MLGANTPTASVVEMAVAKNVDVVAISAAIVDHVPEVEALVAALNERTDAAVLVGGRPFLVTPGLSDTVGADGTAADARTAIDVATQLVTG